LALLVPAHYHRRRHRARHGLRRPPNRRHWRWIVRTLWRYGRDQRWRDRSPN